MTDDLARRHINRRINAEAAQIATAADRLAETATRLAADARAGHHLGEAWPLAAAATSLLQQAARLDGMREVAALLPDKETP